MTFAWYGHLKYQHASLLNTILVSWGIAFFEYCCQVPANRYGAQAGLPTAQLKTIQELISLSVFCIFSLTYMHETLSWNVWVGIGLIALGAAFVFKPF